MNKKLMSNRRCPWCGRVASPPLEFYFTTKECLCCGNRYGWNKKNKTAHIVSILLIVLDLWLLINGYCNLIFFIVFIIAILIFINSKYCFQTYSQISEDVKEEKEIYFYEIKIDKKVDISLNR